MAAELCITKLVHPDCVLCNNSPICLMETKPFLHMQQRLTDVSYENLAPENKPCAACASQLLHKRAMQAIH